MEGAPLSGGQMACAMLFGAAIITYLGLEVSRFRVLVRVSCPEHPRNVPSISRVPVRRATSQVLLFFLNLSLSPYPTHSYPSHIGWRRPLHASHG